MARTPDHLVCEVENRGSKEIPWGFVYVGIDGLTRVGFSTDSEDGKIMFATQGWNAPTGRQVRAAKEALVKVGIAKDEKEYVYR